MSGASSEVFEVMSTARSIRRFTDEPVDGLAEQIGMPGVPAVPLYTLLVRFRPGADRPGLAQSLLAAYNQVRPLSLHEQRALHGMRRAGALRFWISRLWDLHLPREASMLKAHDPKHFERVLRHRVA